MGYWYCFRDAWKLKPRWNKGGRNIGWAEIVSIELGLLLQYIKVIPTPISLSNPTTKVLYMPLEAENQETQNKI
jgi:hypothetical protein